MIETLAGTDLSLSGESWAFAEDNRAGIAAYWAAATAENPTLFNGKVLGARAPRIENGVLSAALIEIDFSAFLAWRDWGYPDKDIYNPFGSAVIAGNDGGYIFGVMGAHTSNAGAIYPCGGSLEPSDIGPGGRVDVWASAARELHEETGLVPDEAEIAGQFLVRWGQLMSFVRVFRFDQPANELAVRIKAELARQAEPELETIVVFTDPEELEKEKLPPYALLIANHLASA